MTARFIPLLALAGLLPLAPGRAAGPPGAAPDPEIQDVVYFGDARPVLFRLYVRIDGKPFREAWAAFEGRLFRYLDRDNDGSLSKAEAEAVPPLQALLGGGFFGNGTPPSLAALDADKDGKVSRAELADYYRKQGAKPFRIGSGGGDGVFRLVGQGGAPKSGEALTKRLFELLDTDKDGKLSRKELEAAPKVLAARDLNDDEMVSADELQGQVGAPAMEGRTIVLDGNVNLEAGGDADGQFHAVTPAGPDAGLGKQLLARYGKGKKSLTAADAGLAPAAFARLDANGDGKLDADELAGFARCRPELEMNVRVGKGGPAVELVPGKGKPAGVTQADGDVAVKLGKTNLSFTTREEGGRLSALFFDVAQQNGMQFKAADRDKNGYLDEKEAKASGFFVGVFKAMDRDGDGKVFENEMVAYFARMKELREAASAACVSLGAKDQGGGLFEMLDADKDGRLSVRELRRAVKLLDELDANKDGFLEKTEIPRGYRVHIRQGSAGGFGDGTAFIVLGDFGMGGGGAPVPPARTEGPVWFRKMDRNRDGDLSRREFLGSDEEFRRIDADGDGLISPAEATKADADARARRKKE